MLDDRAAIAILGPESDNAAPAALAGAEALAAGLARAGYVIVTAGRDGVARAVGRGAAEHEGRVVVVHLESAPPTPGQRAELVAVPTMLRRIETVLGLADAVMILPGELSSLALLLEVWSYGLTPDAPYRQMVLVGDTWPETVKALADAARLDQRTRAMVTFAPNAGEALEAIRYYISPVP